MGGRGPAPKPSHLRQRTNKKSGARTMALVEGVSSKNKPKIPALSNPDGREWHPLTERDWREAWASPMAAEWLPTDANGLGRLAILWDNFWKEGDAKLLAEIRLQEQRYGLSPLDRSRLQWEISRADEAEQKNTRRNISPRQKPAVGDPRNVLTMVPKK